MHAGLRADLNADAGESFGPWRLGDDAAIFPFLSSVNLACGFHAGDPSTIERTVALALEHGLAIGAHPGFHDKQGFGRRALLASEEEIYADTLYQIGALDAFVRAAGARLHHVKPHGALYLQTLHDEGAARGVARAVSAFDPALPLVVLSGSLLGQVALMHGLRAVPEAFPDRAYLDDGRLAPRGLDGAVIHDPELAARRAVSMIKEGMVQSLSGSWVRLKADTLCLHGDHENAATLARAVHQALNDAGVKLQPF